MRQDVGEGCAQRGSESSRCALGVPILCVSDFRGSLSSVYVS